MGIVSLILCEIFDFIYSCLAVQAPRNTNDRGLFSLDSFYCI